MIRNRYFITFPVLLLSLAKWLFLKKFKILLEGQNCDATDDVLSNNFLENRQDTLFSVFGGKYGIKVCTFFKD